MVARDLASSFADYLKACKADERSLSTLPPGRLLLPGDLDGSPALTFAPLALPPDGRPGRNSLWTMMERRYEAYKSVVVKPFFREHFARLDRQIVLVDALQAMNRGPEAVQDLERALTDVLACFRPGTNSLLSSLLGRRIDRVLVAATKADHLHHESHDRLDALTRRLVDRAIDRIGMAGAGIDVMALASVRATREATVKRDGHELPVIVGTPMEGETIAVTSALTARERPRSSPATWLRIRKACSIASPRATPVCNCPMSTSSDSARRNSRKPAAASSCRCRISASTGPCSSCSETVSHEQAPVRSAAPRTRCLHL